MRKNRLTLAIAITAWLGSPAVCLADIIFDFTITGDPGTPGTVTGQIVLPDNANNNTTAATSVFIDSSTIAFPFAVPYDTTPDGPTFNTFTLLNGQITADQYEVALFPGGVLAYGLNIAAGGTNILQTLVGVVATTNASNVTVTPAATAAPEPSALALLGTAVAGLLALSTRRRGIA